MKSAILALLMLAVTTAQPYLSSNLTDIVADILKDKPASI